MKTCRKPIAMVLLLLIHLLTLQIGDAGHNLTNVSNAQNDSKIILEEVIITGNGNNTRILANAVAEDTSKLDDDILSLLSKREIRRSDSTLTNSDLVDQDAAQSRTAIVNANEEDQLEADLEMMSRVIEKYEPQRLTSKKFKRKIVDGSNRTRDIHDKAAGSVTDLERDYVEMLRNISQKTTELSLNNDDLARNSYLSQALKQLKQVYVPEVTIRSVTNDGAKKPHSDIDPSYTLPTLKNKKSRKLLKKYHQSNRTAITPRFWSSEESSSDEETAGSNESSTPAGYFKVSSGKTKPRNGSLSTSPASNSGPAERLKSRKWHIQYPPIQSVSSFTLRLNDSNANNIDENNLKNLNVPSDANAVRLPPRHSTVPRPFSTLPSLNSPVTANIDASYRKPIASPRGFGQQQQQIARSSANVLPLVLPTELFSPPPARRYVPIKRAKHLNLEGNSATVVSTVASPPTSPARERTTLDYNALYTATTRSPLVTVNGQQSSSDYHGITESPAVTTVTKTNFATTYIPSQTSASYVVRQQDDSQATRKENFLPRATTYNSPVDEKSSLNENLGVALYNKFANLHSADVPNIFNAQKAIAQDFKQPVQPTQQQVSTLPYATLKPLTSTRARPIAFSKPAPYYDGVLLVSQDIDRKLGEKSDDNVQANVRPLVKNEDEVEEEDNDDDDDDENYKTRVNQETYKAFETPNKQREKEDRKEEEEDRYPQQSRNYGYQNRDYKYENDDNSKNDDGRKEYEKARYENDDDEEEVDETEEEEHVSIGKSKDKGNDNRQYNKYKYNTDHSDEKQPEKSHYDSKKYNKPKDRHDKLDYGRDVERRFESNNKYFESLGNDDETRERNNEYRERSDKKKKLAGGQYKKDRRDHQYKESEDESIAEDKPIAQRASRQDERYEQEQNNNDKRNYRISPRRDSLREDHAHEEYGESNPTHAREEYHQLVNNDPGIDDSGDQDDGKAEARDHVHGETQEHAHKHEEHHEKKKHGGNHKFEEGGGAEHEEEHHGHKGEKGDKGYKVWHEHEKADKGHHNKEHASKHYDEKGGEEKKHEEEGEYHEEHHHGEEGKKASEFGEKGEHKKGHSTHGKHSVHKKDEFEKKTEFFDEFHDDGDIEKHGEHHHAHESKKGGHEKKGHHDIADHEEKHGKEEKHEKGGHNHEHKGHKDEEGHDHHYDNDHKYGKKEGHEHGKKWSFKKGDGGGDAGGGHKHNR